jgi:exodeoxyribonuclease V alpha subunit
VTAGPVLAGSTVVDPYDPTVTALAAGRAAQFQAAGILTAADIHVALRLGELGKESDESVLLAVALTVRAARLGSVCLELAAAPEQIVADSELDGDDEPAAPTALPWPDPDAWAAAIAASPLVDTGPVRPRGKPLQLALGLVSLDRFWVLEELVAAELSARTRRSHDAPPALDERRLAAALDRLFQQDPQHPDEPDRQRAAAELAARHWVTVLAGGPGTGKTTTVARILALLMDQPGPAPQVALAAPTGKAAMRLGEAVQEAVRTFAEPDQERLAGLTASTLHRLLGSFGSGSRFRHHARNRLAHDVVIVDESSMISLTMMARLLDAVRPDARLVLVGDPEQLASVEAGAVLGDIVDAAHDAAHGGNSGASGAAGSIVVLERSWRFAGHIAQLAHAVQVGDGDEVMRLLRMPSDDVSFVEVDAPASGSTGGGALAALRDDVVDAARGLTEAARRGDAEQALRQLGVHRLLCAHRSGPYGVDRWTPELERWIDAALAHYRGAGEWHPGRPLLVTVNDYDVHLFNGDTGVIISDGAGGVTAAFGQPSAPQLIRPARIGSVQTMQAMTVHRSQGSQFERISVLLPAEGSPLLTRQLLYTAVTRAQRHVRVIGTEAAVRAAVATPITRASGLRTRLAPR